MKNLLALLKILVHLCAASASWKQTNTRAIIAMSDNKAKLRRVIVAVLLATCTASLGMFDKRAFSFLSLLYSRGRGARNTTSYSSVPVCKRQLGVIVTQS